MPVQMPVAQDLVDVVRGLLAEAMDIDPKEIRDEAHFANDLGVDSLMAMEVVVVLEKRFDVTITDEEMQALSCLKNVMTLLQTKGIA
jgi:acyl carrier protein